MRIASVFCVVVAISCGGPCPTGAYGFTIDARGTQDDLDNAAVAVCQNESCQAAELTAGSDGGLVIDGLPHGDAYAAGPGVITLVIITPHLVVGDRWRVLVVDKTGTIRFDQTRTAALQGDCNLTGVWISS